MIAVFGLGWFAEEPEPHLPTLASDILRCTHAGGHFAIAVETVDTAPAISGESLKRHDTAVRALAAQAESFLPARFGQTFADRAALLEAVVARAPAFAEALTLVRGCSQMTLRWFGEAEIAPEPTALSAGEGPGARYLARRRAELAAENTLPEVAAEQQRLQPFVRGERVRRGGGNGLLGTVYHLVADSDLARYRAELAELEAAATLRLRASGPWPNYAFAPELAG